jgi:hypothetical protein
MQFKMEQHQKYKRMLLESHKIPWENNIFAVIFSWMILAGFILLPGTFTSLSRMRLEGEVDRVFQQLNNPIPLFVVSSISCFLGAAGTGWLWWKFRKNYIWLFDHLFL